MPCKKKGYTTTQAFRALGAIDRKHEGGKITKKQHDTQSKAVLRKLTRK